MKRGTRPGDDYHTNSTLAHMSLLVYPSFLFGLFLSIIKFAAPDSPLGEAFQKEGRQEIYVVGNFYAGRGELFKIDDIHGLAGSIIRTFLPNSLI